ncbi:MAG TPA: extracellular solute-binding protein, partial [Acetobacteraceae bacterium]|nr:extracellular solute-binding protein [Acetobacteraceae bacterium]
MGTLSRRTLLTGAASVPLAMPFVIPALAADTLVVTAYGGEYQDVFVPTVVTPFEKKFGVKVTYDLSGGAAQTYAKIRASHGAPGFDVAAELTPPEAILGAKDKLLEPVTEREVPNLKYQWEKGRSAIPPVGIVPCYQYLALLWNKEKIEKPDSWADYWAPGQKYG